jgi:hypothetical protein
MTPTTHSPRYPHVTYAMIAAELTREGKARRRTYPGMIEQGRMTPEQAEHGYQLAAAWLEDVQRFTAYLALPAPRGHAMPAEQRTLGFTWAERRAGIDRELGQRHRLYPRWIEAARLDAAEAQRRIDCLMVMAEIYDDGLDWHDSFGTRPIFPLLTANHVQEPAQREALAQWLAHVHHVLTARSGEQNQQELAL